MYALQFTACIFYINLFYACNGGFAYLPNSVDLPIKMPLSQR